MNPKFVGRSKEIEILQNTLKSDRSELIAVIGRRRVGKTHLIRQVYNTVLDFEMTGMQHTAMSTQLTNFATKITQYAKPEFPIKTPENWLEAFNQLQIYLSRRNVSRKRIIFFDELPWIATSRSGFLEALGHFWNDWAAYNQVVIIICGSAASWMIQQVVHHKGSLHNRITKLIHLQPFTLAETALFLQVNKIALNHFQIVQLYMVTGGIPHYLKEIQKGQSVAQNIDQLCFSGHGLLKDEFDKLYASLYDKPENHIALIRSLASKWMGLTRSQLLKLTGMKDGGRFSRILTELEQSDFIISIPPFHKKKKDMLYRLVDNYSLFYLKFMEGKKKGSEGSFLSLERSQSWKVWCGYAFENICFTHIPQIKASLGIGAVYTEESSYIQKGNTKKKGIQVDMLIDRADGIINVCEMKFYDVPFTVNKKTAEELQEKRNAIKQVAPPKKSILLTMITCFGLQENMYSSELIQNQLTIEHLFQ
ncbi:ATP-binding protein [Flavitalea sp. BT771]|uniref:AAA family ATPase n=1 Tax=Flavitalea sp. BT771 TaxID=3063329 RepID=UPI0026E1484A|nr:ATP-binding protein [Flavitalea sp. BT771]MDO6432713.1 ATP-binding protein [Flavitalea sp. BT771]MDV6222011.1 ATP-binding protein [Flavitalea sp. BT771]